MVRAGVVTGSLGLDGGLPPGVLSCCGREDVTHHDFFHQRGVEPGLVNQGANDRGAELGRVGIFARRVGLEAPRSQSALRRR